MPDSSTAKPVDAKGCRQIARFHLAIWAIAFFVAMALPIHARAQKFPYLVIDRQTGDVLLENRSFERWYPASLTKLMTLYVTLRAIDAGEIAAGSPVVMSKYAASQPPSKMGYVPGTRLRLDTAMKILIVKSANDVAIALAEAVAGNVGSFVKRMNGEAARLGLADSHFVNPNGLHSPDQYVSARDIAALARQILEEFPQYAPNFAIPAIQAGDKVHYSYNLLLERFAGADGMKTGFVCASGYNMVASATRNGRQLIAVVLGAFSQTERAVTAAQILLSGFETAGGKPIAEFAKSEVPAKAKSQSATMCSEKARKTRYDPGAGDAKIDSPLLGPRKILRQPVIVSPGGIDAPPSDAFAAEQLAPKGKIPIPVPRPDYSRVDVDGERSANLGQLRGAIPVPVWRP